MDEPDGHDACRFLQVLQSFDLTQHVSKSTHRKGHILDLIITRADKDIIRECTVEDLFISNHLAVHSSLRLAKLSLERKKILYRKIRAFDYDEFCYHLENSSLVRDAATLDLVDLASQYNTTLGSLLDVYAPLKSTTITLRPTVSWYTDEIRFEKHNRI